jgi:enamine deaminase RidA (YjgF/YER057c/UK114 family)
MAELQRSVVNTDKAPQPIGAYSQAIRIRGGELMFVAGQVAVDINGNLVGAGDMAAQTRQVFENLQNILAGVGASFSNVLEFTTYVVGRENVQPYIQARSDVYPGLFPNGDYPANTLLVISGLVKDEYLLEIKAVAALP